MEIMCAENYNNAINYPLIPRQSVYTAYHLVWTRSLSCCSYSCRYVR